MPLSFGNVAMPSFNMTAASFNAAQWATSMGERSFFSPFGMRGEHEGWERNISWSAKHMWNMHDDNGKGWKHHDDDGDDDSHTASVPEPATGFLVFSGIAALAGWRVRRRSARNSSANLA
jgi:hypothetical protein